MVMDVNSTQHKNKLACVRCGKYHERQELVYNMVCSGFMCLKCYHELFPHIPISPRPVQLKEYR